MRNRMPEQRRSIVRSKTSKRRPVREIAAVRAEVHAGDGDLAIAGVADAVDLRQHVAQRTAPACPSRGRDDAVGARLIAAGLHAESERGAARQARRNRRAASAVAVSEPLAPSSSAASPSRQQDDLCDRWERAGRLQEGRRLRQAGGSHSSRSRLFGRADFPARSFG